MKHIDWKDLDANGGTDTAGAIELATSVMQKQYLGMRNYRPVVILITDGESNDRHLLRVQATLMLSRIIKIIS